MTASLRSIRGHVALVTGAASGMGRATARLFAEEGALVAVPDVAAEGAEAVAAEIAATGGTARAWTLDVGDPGCIARSSAKSAAGGTGSTSSSTTPGSRAGRRLTTRTMTRHGSR